MTFYFVILVPLEGDKTSHCIGTRLREVTIKRAGLLRRPLSLNRLGILANHAKNLQDRDKTVRRFLDYAIHDPRLQRHGKIPEHDATSKPQSFPKFEIVAQLDPGCPGKSPPDLEFYRHEAQGSGHCRQRWLPAMGQLKVLIMPFKFVCFIGKSPEIGDPVKSDSRPKYSGIMN